MAVITLIGSAGAFFAGGFITWYTLWHHRLEASFERVPVGTGRSAHVLREGVSLGSDAE